MKMPERPNGSLDRLPAAWRNYLTQLESALGDATDKLAIAHGDAAFTGTAALYVPRGHGVWQTPVPLPKFSDLVLQPQGNRNAEIVMRENSEFPGWAELSCQDGGLLVQPRFTNNMLVRRKGFDEQ
jgi:hypothetical protein